MGNTTEKERVKIKQLYDLGMTVTEIVKLTGRAKTTVYPICAGTYETKREANKLRMREKQKAITEARKQQEEQVLDAAIAKKLAQKEAEERKRQETRDRIREEAEKAGIPGCVREAMQEAAPANPFDNDNLLMRVADSNDYTNALLNGIMVRLEKLCTALGVGE